MAQFKIYSWNDSGAPPLNGMSGSLCRILSASLVAGYGDKAPAGWLCPFSASNVMVFQQPSGSGFCLRLDDRGSSPLGLSFGWYGGTTEARATGYEAMTSIDTGSGQFPISTQITYGSGSVNIRKCFSTTNFLTASQAWHIIADDRTFYMIMQSIAGTANYTGWMFGDIYSFQDPDPYKCIIIGRVVESTQGTYNGLDTFSGELGTANVVGHYMARSYTGLGASYPVGKHGNCAMAGDTGAALYGELNFPNPQDGAFWLSPVLVTEGDAIRGKLRGFWQYLHEDSAGISGDNITLSGSGNLSNKTFRMFISSSTYNHFVFETSDTVDTNP